ncbi:ArsR/SmtB family transcription factor [Gephyromycinifex aptenodytis]|uniref:ArsR/SmtB family transcription factor n=1 Tax=Gephyromycinifex aptenodytis TaxID=2716227 RepID=UPI001D025E91|nr:metalloregulator ArsR/SmtB family transcription factor [Gephyromycinifex aptenodytis]
MAAPNMLHLDPARIGAGSAPTADPTSSECAPGAADDLLAADEAAAQATLFKALSDPTRLRLLRYVAASPQGTACACHLPDALGISQPTLSHHMKKLVEAGLVTREQRGRWAHYTLNDATLARARAALSAQP